MNARNPFRDSLEATKIRLQTRTAELHEARRIERIGYLRKQLPNLLPADPKKETKLDGWVTVVGLFLGLSTFFLSSALLQDAHVWRVMAPFLGAGAIVSWFASVPDFVARRAEKKRAALRESIERELGELRHGGSIHVRVESQEEVDSLEAAQALIERVEKELQTLREKH